MRMIEISLLVMAFYMAVSTSAAASRVPKPLLMGINYLPQVTCVEDFNPYWITDNWTEKRMVNDLKIMKALGCSGVRFHIAPAVPENYKIPGVDSNKIIPMMDLAVKTAEDLQLRVHIDISGGETQYGEEGVKLYVSRYKGKVESYQIGNEQYGWPKDPERMKWLQGLVELAKSIDPDVKVSADMLVPDWMKIREETRSLQVARHGAGSLLPGHRLQRMERHLPLRYP